MSRIQLGDVLKVLLTLGSQFVLHIKDIRSIRVSSKSLHRVIMNSNKTKLILKCEDGYDFDRNDFIEFIKPIFCKEELYGVQFKRVVAVIDTFVDLLEGLQYLDFSNCPHVTDEMISRFPRSLKILEIDLCQKVTDVGINSLPPYLIGLNISQLNKIKGIHFNTISRNLTELDCSGCINMEDEAISMINIPSLRKLNLSSDEKLTQKSIRNLPRNLTTLRMDYCTMIFDHPFPSNLALLSVIGCAGFNCDSIIHIPKSVIRLNISNTGVMTLKNLELVSNLKYLSSMDLRIKDDDLKFLPNGLLELDICSCEGITNQGLLNLPKSTKYINIRMTSITRTDILGPNVEIVEVVM